MGTHILTDEKVAVKILEKDKIVDVNDVERVAREIHILKILRHPVVVQLYEIIETEKELYLIMEYARGGELFDYIVSHKRVREKEAARFMHQIISGIEYLHKLGICHRDLKPENLLMDDYNNIKIVDFGLSNTYKPGETLKTACGSPCYAAPEMVAGKRYDGLSRRFLAQHLGHSGERSAHKRLAHLPSLMGRISPQLDQSRQTPHAPNEETILG